MDIENKEMAKTNLAAATDKIYDVLALINAGKLHDNMTGDNVENLLSQAIRELENAKSLLIN